MHVVSVLRRLCSKDSELVARPIYTARPSPITKWKKKVLSVKTITVKNVNISLKQTKIKRKPRKMT